MSLASIEARARSKARSTDPRMRVKQYAAAERVRREANLAADGIVVPLSEWLGHNNGPQRDEYALFVDYCWKLAHRAAWAAPTPEIAVRRARKAHALGVTYRAYVLEILERGRFLDASTALSVLKN